MYNWDNYDNDIAYSYDDYVEPQEENEDAYEDYLLQKQIDEKAEQIDPLEYESKMAQQMIDNIYNENN